MKHLVLLILFLISLSQLQAQCKNQVQITDENINEITSWKQLTYIYQDKTNNHLYKLIKKAINYKRYDSLQLVRIIDSIGADKRFESYCFLFNFCCRWIDYSKINSFTELAFVVNKYGGSRVLSKYYLHDSISKSLNKVDYWTQVYFGMRKIWDPVCYYCKPEPPKPVPVDYHIPFSVKKAMSARTDCDSILPINNENINDFGTPYQLCFLNEIPKNRIDSLVKELLYENKGKDSLQMSSIVDSIGSTRSDEAWCLLYTMCCRPIIIHDLNLFNTLSGVITYYGGYHMINKYFLDNVVDEKLNYYEFGSAVILASIKKEPVCYYCKPEDPMLKYKRELSKINTQRYDNEIIRIINKYSDLRKFGGYEFYGKAIDTIYKEVISLPFVGDAYFDFCQDKIALYPGYETLGVILMIDDKPVEKCYIIQVGEIYNYKLFGLHIGIKRRGNLQKLIYKNNFINPGFIAHQKELCNPDKQE